MEITEVQREVEAVSAHYAERHNTSRTDGWFVLKLREEIGELTQAYLARAGQVLLIPERFDIDRPIASKWLV